MPLIYFHLSILCTIIGISFFTQKIQILEKEKLNKNISNIGGTSEEFWRELNIRYNVTKLVQEVGEITSVVQSEIEISSAVSEVMRKRLDYNRGAILLTKNDRNSLFFAGGYGFSKDEIDILNNIKFRLDYQTSGGILQKVFNKQEPQIIGDINKLANLLNIKNRELIKKLQIKAMACVPIIHEGKSLGVLAVDSLNPHSEFREGDIKKS